MNMKLPANLSNLLERSFLLVALNIHSFPQMVPLISIQTRSNCKLQKVEGGQAKTYCKNQSMGTPVTVLFHSSPSSTPTPTPNLIATKILSVLMSFSHLLPYTSVTTHYFIKVARTTISLGWR